MTTIEDTDQLITSRQLEQMLSLAPGTAATLRLRGTLKIPHFKLGARGIRYRLSDVRAYVNARKVETTAAAGRGAE